MSGEYEVDTRDAEPACDRFTPYEGNAYCERCGWRGEDHSEGSTDEWNAAPPKPPAGVGLQWTVAVYRNHRCVGTLCFADEADAAAFHDFVNQPAPAPSTPEGR